MAKTTKSYRIDTLDIESQGYTVVEAMRELRYFIEEMKKGNKIIAKVIHGYGSTGTGGAIKKSVENYLRTLQRQKQIKAFLPGNVYFVTGYVETREKYAKFLKADGANRHSNEGITYICFREP